MIKEKLITE